MLAGCSSTLLSPRHRLRSEASAQFQACHFPAMSTQRLDLPCSFPRKDTQRVQPVRPLNISVDKQVESRASGCSLKQSIRLPPSATTPQPALIEARRESRHEFWEGTRSLKRYAEQGSLDDECCIRRAKRNRSAGDSVDSQDDDDDGDNLSSGGQLGGANFWFQTAVEVPQSVPLIAEITPPQVPFSLSCSGEDDRICYIPSDVISLPFPSSSNNPWVESIVTEITDIGGQKVEISQEQPTKDASGSSTSSESQSLGPGPSENSEHEVGNGSRPSNPTESTEVVVPGHNGNHQEHDGFELISLVVACVEAISAKNLAGINQLIARLGELASPRGSPMSRLTAYFTEALALRVGRIWPHIFHISASREIDRVDDNGTGLRLLNQVSPIPKFIHFTSNEILLRAFEGKDRVHIIDFDIKQGLQWPSLFQSLASRTNPPSHVRITGIGDSKQELNETGDRLAGFAEALNLPFEFHPVVDRLEDVRLWMLHVKEKESVAVNCVFQMHKMLYDGSGGALRDFLSLIRSTNPVVVLMAEQEADHNGSRLEARVSNSLRYYAAVFDALDVSLPLVSPVRMKIEEMFASEIRNIVACEGRDRLERHERFGRWRAMMEQGGFRCMGIGERELLQGRMLLRMYPCEGYRVEENRGQDGLDSTVTALTLSWLDQPLYTVSAWTPLDVAGSSTSYSQPS